MNAIGGYFELELRSGEEYHKDAIKLNTGRNAFEYILRANKYKKVYLPYYTCDVMLEPIKKLNLDFEFYKIDKNFVPIFNFLKVLLTDVFVYTNYFGVCDNQVKVVSHKCKNLIVDNSQAFYSKPLLGVDTFYSARKFFGVPDGAYLYTDHLLDVQFETDRSYQRCEHLLGRLDTNAEEFYDVFKNDDDSLINQPIKKMSKLTQRLMSSIDYSSIAGIRKMNFNFLHSHLHNDNELELNLESNAIPMIYPYLINKGEQLKNDLIQNNVFVATYWPNVKDWVKSNDSESNVFSNLLAIPIDQRYETQEMEYIISLIQKH